ncbi:hypothetical protein A3Q56_06760 [Intoshia linei]|uniref:DNA mismatch repair proteins mutS family domain-containing protein n=1 Tax=Intoshia linei TaxID=1819745 RepID=A0A177AU55_9BILA|nr:hypothetical protein A3Q56_06760 [Intoshia linei]
MDEFESKAWDFYQSNVQSDTFTCFKHGDSYVLFNEEAEDVVHKILDCPDLLKCDSEGLKKVKLSNYRYATVVRQILFTLRKRILVYENIKYCQDIDSVSNLCIGNWFLKAKGSPGDISQFEDILVDHFNASEKSGVLSISVGSNFNVDVAFLDQFNQLIKVSSFMDDDKFNNLQTIIVQLYPQEAILNGKMNHTIKNSLQKLLDKCSVIVSHLSDKEVFDKDETVSEIKILLNKNYMYFINNLTKGMCMAIDVLMKQYHLLSTHSVDKNAGFYIIEEYSHKRYVRVDLAASRAINLFDYTKEKLKVGCIKSVDCLYDLLNQCKTFHGSQLLATWIKQPLHDIGLINERLDVVELFIKDSNLLKLLNNNVLPELGNLYKVGRCFRRKNLDIEKLIAIYQSIESCENLYNILTESDSFSSSNGKILQNTFSGVLIDILCKFKPYQKMINKFIDLNKYERKERDMFTSFIRPNVSEELFSLIDKLEKINSKVEKEYNRVKDEFDCNIKLEKVKTNHKITFLYRIVLKDEPLLRPYVSKKQFNVIDTQKAGVRFTNNALENYSELYNDIFQEYDCEEKKLLKSITDTCYQYINVFDQLLNVTAKLDVLVAFAVLISESSFPFVRPQFHSEGQIIFKNLRHPIVELKQDIEFISNDCTFYKPDSAIFKLITGPNMGGKSTYIRSVGLAVIMAHMGCYVAADEAHISLVDSVLCRIGSNDSTLMGLSTFMNEMLEMSSIINTASSHSLVIIDELGRGTSTYDGFGLSWAISKYLVKNIKCFCLFATHFHELDCTMPQRGTLLSEFEQGCITSLLEENVAIGGRPYLLDERSKRNMSRIMLNNDTPIAAHIIQDLGLNVSTNTIYILDQIIFSDEKGFLLDGRDGHGHYWTHEKELRKFFGRKLLLFGQAWATMDLHHSIS